MKKIKCIIGCLVYLNSYSQIELDPVTVTGSLTQQQSSKTGRNIITIKGELFNKLPVNSIDELLRYLPGIELQMRGPQGSQSDILIRGGTFQQVLVILDGIRLNDPLTGHFNSYIPIAPAEIDRIEILKGASSAIYGSDAVGGVIHIISKTFAAKHSTNAASTQIAGGGYGLFNVGAGGYYHKNKSAFSAGIISNNANGQQQRGTKGFFHNTTLSTSFKQQLKNWNIALRSSYDKRNFAAQNFYTAFTSDTATEKVHTWWNHFQLAYQKGKQQFSFNAGYKQTRDEYFFTKNLAPNLNNSKVIQSQAVYSYQFNSKTSLTGGAQFINRSITSNDRGNHHVNSIAGFLMLNKQVGNNLNVSSAIRFEKELIPQLNVSYKIKKLLLRGSAGKTIRDADFTERYNNYNKALVSSGNIGNPDLTAEKSWSYEAGADYFLSNTLKVSATFFTKKYSQLIDWVNTAYAAMPRKVNLSPTGNYFLASNISKLTTSGVEMDIQFSKKIDSDHSVLSTLGMVIINNNSTPSLYISSSAKFLLNYSFAYSYKWLQLGASGIYKNRVEQKGNAALAALSKDYFVCNFRLDAKLFFIQCDNAFNKKYADRFGVPMPGRWWMGGIKFTINKPEKVK